MGFSTPSALVLGVYVKKYGELYPDGDPNQYHFPVQYGTVIVFKSTYNPMLLIPYDGVGAWVGVANSAAYPSTWTKLHNT